MIMISPFTHPCHPCHACPPYRLCLPFLSSVMVLLTLAPLLQTETVLGFSGYRSAVSLADPTLRKLEALFYFSDLAKPAIHSIINQSVGSASPYIVAHSFHP